MDLINQCMEYKNNLVKLGTEACNLLETYITLLKGSFMSKYTFKHGKKQEKEFSISSDFLFFQWKPVNSSRGPRKFSLSEIVEITEGNSDFNCKTHNDIKKDPETLCFTVHLKDRPVNIVATSESQRYMWVQGLQNMIKNYKPSIQEEIVNNNNMITDTLSKITEELRSFQEKEMVKSSESIIIMEDSEVAQLKKKIKDLEKNINKLQKENFEIRSKVDKEYKVEDELKKEIRTKEKSEKKIQSQLELLNLQFENLEKEHTQNILSFEEKLSLKDSKILELQTEYDEFKKQIKESFNRTLVQKVQQYRESKEVLCSYVNFLKDRLETIEKEVALWQAVVHTHVLPIYQSKKSGKPPQFKQVLEFALDTMERKLLTDRSQTQFMSLLIEARKNVKT